MCMHTVQSFVRVQLHELRQEPAAEWRPSNNKTIYRYYNLHCVVVMVEWCQCIYRNISSLCSWFQTWHWSMLPVHKWLSCTLHMDIHPTICISHVYVIACNKVTNDVIAIHRTVYMHRTQSTDFLQTESVHLWRDVVILEQRVLIGQFL